MPTDQPTPSASVFPHIYHIPLSLPSRYQVDETETNETKSVPSTRESTSGSIKSRVKEPLVTETKREANKLSVDLKKKPRKKRKSPVLFLTILQAIVINRW
eukprot:TRINITY_DN554_c0_g1_i6.p1 TRINITY_DN554_c0_g1~~TRINITY_DN554_c0_g1_i6.p1  ORF type:complete len:101 (+),score=13.41 TRINITY_DN554_c0_g1_i6:353-655(+)